MIFATRTVHYHSPLAMVRGLKELFVQGLRPRDVNFIAFDPAGDVHVEIPARFSEVNRLRVGNKLSLPWPFEGRMFYMDAVHPLGADVVVINGDRRIGGLSAMVDVASMMSWFVTEAHADQSIFFGCTPHQPGSWWVSGECTEAFHTRGFVDIVATAPGLLARRIMDPGLYFLPAVSAVRGEMEHWKKIYTSPLGNLLMLERRMLYDQLVLSCQGGLVELDLYDLPRASETGRFTIEGGWAVVGRISGGAFAVTRGEAKDWGLDHIMPAMLVGSDGCSFMELRKLMQELSG